MIYIFIQIVLFAYFLFEWFEETQQIAFSFLSG